MFDNGKSYKKNFVVTLMQALAEPGSTYLGKLDSSDADLPMSKLFELPMKLGLTRVNTALRMASDSVGYQFIYPVSGFTLATIEELGQVDYYLPSADVDTRDEGAGISAIVYLHTGKVCVAGTIKADSGVLKPIIYIKEHGETQPSKSVQVAYSSTTLSLSVDQLMRVGSKPDFRDARIIIGVGTLRDVSNFTTQLVSN